jgi:ectoine hydroxylase-related dioxygenase (phytanoyl-CoA dioxygenase family)
MNDVDVTVREGLRALHQEGYLLLTGVLGPAAIDWARQAIDRLSPQHWDYTGLVDHYKCLFNRDPGWLRYLDVSPVIELMEAALGADCHIIGQTAWRCHPGFIGAELHTDHLALELPEAWLADPGFELPMQICTAHFFLDDIDADLSPTCVIPGSHRSGRRPAPGETRWRGREPQPVLCRAGDVLLFRSDLWHSGSRNRSQRIRYLLQVHYGRRMVAQKFSPYLTFRFEPRVLAAATARQRRLLGDHEPAEYD